jgi:alpha-L-fucosidase 2
VKANANLFDFHPPFQIDGNLGAVAGYCGMVAQSHTGDIRLLPALRAAWPTGKVSGLCAAADSRWISVGPPVT